MDPLLRDHRCSDRRYLPDLVGTPAIDDDNPSIGAFRHGSLTSVDQPWAEMGLVAAKFLPITSLVPARLPATACCTRDRFHAPAPDRCPERRSSRRGEAHTSGQERADAHRWRFAEAVLAACPDKRRNGKGHADLNGGGQQS